jgi:predicted RNase H-like nuclease (RuvC/YqgF family)
MNSTSNNTSMLEAQIQEARLRAELFTKSLHDARNQENVSLKTLEEERSRWTKSFEEKSTLIDQLERELSFTVDALHSLPRPPSDFVPGPFVMDRNGNTAHHQSPPRRTTEYDHNSSRVSYIFPAAPPNPFVLNGSTPQRSIAEAPAFPAGDQEYNEIRNLVVRLQEQNTSLVEQVEKLSYDNKIKKHKMEQLEADIRKLEDEKRLQQVAIRDFDGKLHFRINQVCDCLV